jgi:branched-chain amino acid transport system ATP-binding protein
VLPELLSNLAEYRLLFFGVLLLVVLWLAPEGILGTLARLFRRIDPRTADGAGFDVAAYLAPDGPRAPLEIRDIGITFGGIKAAADVSFSAESGKITSVIGPNGAGKTTVLNMIGGFYRPDAGSIRLGKEDIAGQPAWKVARAGIARTYQTTKLFETMDVLDNILIAMRRGGWVRCCRTLPARAILPQPRRCWPLSATTTRWRARPATCPMSAAGWWKSPARLRCGRGCCCWMSPRPG